MTISARHEKHIAFVASDGHRLTRRERLAKGLAPDLRAARRAVAAPPDFPVCPERFAWYLLAVRGRRELAIAEVLRLAGYAAFVPLEMVETRANRYRRHKRELHARALVARLVAVGFALDCTGKVGGIPWGKIIGVQGVRNTGFVDIAGVLMMDGTPLRMRDDAVRWLGAVHHRRGRARGFAPVIGEAARIAIGKYAGFSGVVSALVEGTAKLEIAGHGLFAGHVVASVPEVWLEEAA